MAFFTNDYIDRLESSIVSDVSKVQYQLSGSWHDSIILSQTTKGAYRCFFCEIPSEVSGTITGIRLIDEDIRVIGEEMRSINKNSGQAFSFEVNFKIEEKAAGRE